IWETTDMTIDKALEFFNNLKISKKEKEIADVILKEIINRLQFLIDVGLQYIKLNRKSGTLSGGEAQRIRLASQVGTKLVGALYVLDEPTIGLHQRDNELLVKTLRNLCDMGNTIIVVEHDEDTILASDWIVDFGPRAGKNGGQIMFNGEVKELLKGESKSLTGKYLRREEVIETPSKRREISKTTPQLKVIGAFENNLKNISTNIPLGKLVCLTGVSGSGKSTLMNDIVYNYVTGKLNHFKRDIKVKEIKNIEYVDRIIKMDQSMIGKSPRSNPATYTKAYDEIRNLFASTPEARMKGYKSGRFSFNVAGGRCENCQGRGTMEIEMHFLPNVEIMCDFCKGKRFNKETLAVHYKNKNIAEVLEMTIEEAEKFFKDIPLINDKLKVLNDVGLGYLTLGQSATTLSGGESQRIKLGRELSKRSTGKTLYLLDEPTTGLHYDDIKKLILVLQKLVDRGNTVMVIEHNLDFIKCADWIIDLGEDGGDNGGKIVGEGTPEEIARLSSWTGYYLRKTINEKLERKN
ncbi:MAG: excinuclease ABC subunit UvrA, partial [Candidatus Pacebacteria bacterium]|nr:excinuclease ABC subunit UvrA [Candidatus Paceibacterota bacterium]